jgi:hypothetical protein
MSVRIHKQQISVCITLYTKIDIGPRIVKHDCPEVLRVVNDPAWLPLFVTMVPVSSGKVSVRLVLLLGLAMVNMPVPEASGAREIFDMCYSV